MPGSIVNASMAPSWLLWTPEGHNEFLSRHFFQLLVTVSVVLNWMAVGQMFQIWTFHEFTSKLRTCSHIYYDSLCFWNVICQHARCPSFTQTLKNKNIYLLTLAKFISLITNVYIEMKKQIKLNQQKSWCSRNCSYFGR